MNMVGHNHVTPYLDVVLDMRDSRKLQECVEKRCAGEHRAALVSAKGNEVERSHLLKWQDARWSARKLTGGRSHGVTQTV